MPQSQLHTVLTGLITVTVMVMVVGCGSADEDDWQLNDVAGERWTMASCPNGGNTTPTPPAFGASIDGYASYVGQSKCDPTAKPGVVAFKDLVLATYPCTKSYGITRSCSVGGKSEHKEGRAWDWGLNYPHPAATAFLAWLLATDAHGNKHAMARRFGIMYMIWNKKIWKSYQASKGWQSYTGSSPHTDHVHFSFSWDGANKKTSYWTAPPPPPPPPANQTPHGWIDKVGCDAIAGWAQDPDDQGSAVQVDITIDGTSFVVKAGDYRSDLCGAIGSCEHGFSISTPSTYKDGQAHTVRAFAIDLKSGDKTELSGSPKQLTCGAPPQPTPPAPGSGSNPTEPDSGVGGGGWSDGGLADPDNPTPGLPPGLPPAAPHQPKSMTLEGGGCSVGGSGKDAGALAPLFLLGLLVLVRKRS